MNLRYRIDPTGKTTKLIPSLVWNTSSIVSVRSVITGWSYSLKPEATYNQSNLNIFFGRRFGFINSPHIVNICWTTMKDTDGSLVFKFYSDVQLRNSRTIQHLIDVKDRDSVIFTIEDWTEHFLVTARKEFQQGTDVRQQVSKNGERSWTWTGGTIVEPQWKSLSTFPLKDLFLYISVD